MAPPATLAWLFPLLAWTLAAAGALLLLWSLFRDRPRGRRRCPRCWYDMTGIPGLRCPECGREQRRERRLHKTRRRWGWAAIAVGAMAAASAVHDVPAIRARGAWAAVPRPVLCLLLPFVSGDRDAPGAAPRPPSALETELRMRLLESPHALRTLWPGESWLVWAGSMLVLGRDGSEARADLAAALLVLTDDRAIERAPDRGRAQVILAASGLKYARARTYRDVGLVKGAIGIRDERPFLTAFERDGRLRFEFLSGHPTERRLSKRYVVWGRPPEVRTWWTILPGVQTYADFGMALAGPTGVSGGSASNIPFQLLGWGGAVRSLRRPVLRGTELFDGHECYLIRGEDFLGLPWDIWVDRSLLAVRKIHQHWGEFPSVTVYRPEFDAPSRDTDFQFDPSSPAATPLGTGEEVCRTLAPLAGDPHEGAIPVPADHPSRLGRPVRPRGRGMQR